MARRMSVGSIQVHGSGSGGGGAKALAQGKGVGISSPTTSANVGNMVSMGRKLLPPPSQPSITLAFDSTEGEDCIIDCYCYRQGKATGGG